MTREMEITYAPMAGQFLLVVTESGYGKRVPVADIPVNDRDRQGVRITAKDHTPAGAAVVTIHDETVIVTRNGKVARVAVAELPIKDRRARGVRVAALEPGDRVARVAAIPRTAFQLHSDASYRPSTRKAA